MLKITISWRKHKWRPWVRSYIGGGIPNPDAVWPAELSILTKPDIVAVIEIYEDGAQFKYEKVS
jgi:hypothetical protein